jgi:SOS-response transcriptional repressor LexA
MTRRKITAAERRFGERLQKLRIAADLTQAIVARRFHITVQAVSAWERGAVRPDQGKLVTLSGLYGVSSDELLGEPTKGGRKMRTALPVISAVQAGHWTPTADPFPIGAVERTVTCDTPVSAYAYALEVAGRSMERRFTEGDVVIIEPRTQLDPLPRDFVVVKLEDREEATFKQFWRERAGSAEIRALNEEEFDPIILNQDVPGEIIGVMVEHHSYRRR